MDFQLFKFFENLLRSPLCMYDLSLPPDTKEFTFTSGLCF